MFNLPPLVEQAKQPYAEQPSADLTSADLTSADQHHMTSAIASLVAAKPSIPAQADPTKER